MSDAVYTEMDSPIGALTLVAEDGRITGIEMRPAAGAHGVADATWTDDDATLAEARRQLEAYFAGDLRGFDLPLAPRGTPFQLRVWHALEAIPYGETTSYGAVADAIGEPGHARAVGAANGSNPIPIVVPCHRVIGANGSLVGYGGGLERKRTLLDLEARAVGRASLELPL